MSLWALQSLKSITNVLKQYKDGRQPSEEATGSYILTLELIYREFVVKNIISSLDDSEEAAVRHIVSALKILTDIQQQSMEEASYRPPVLYTGRSGRPRFDITEVQLKYLLDNHFTVPRIASIIGVSSRTIERRLSQFGLSVRSRYSNLTDAELKQIMSDIKEDHPQCGNLQMKGFLLSKGIRVQQQRIRETLRAVDPEGSILRRLNAINRRKYRVPAPRSLWHIDGNHKLIK